MDRVLVEMLCLSSGMAELPPDLRALANDPDWWANLELTPEDELSDEQQRMIAALGAEM